MDRGDGEGGKDVPTIWILTSTWMSFSDRGLILTRPGSTAR